MQTVGESVEYDLGLPFLLQSTAGQAPSGASMRSGSRIGLVMDLMLEKLAICGDRREVEVSGVAGCRIRVRS